MEKTFFFRAGILCLLMWGGLSLASTAREAGPRACNLRIYYRWNRSVIEPDFHRNGERLDSIASLAKRLMSDSTVSNVRLRITSFASLEGRDAYNAALARRRTEAVLRFLEQTAHIDRSRVEVTDSVYDWSQLRHRLEKASAPELSQALDILVTGCESSPTPGKTSDLKRRLVSLRRGEAYRYIQRHYAGEMRNTSVTWSYEQLPPASDSATTSLPEPLPAPAQPASDEAQEPVVPAPPVHRHFYMAVKTNLLYDALAVPNLGVEFYLGKNWSAGAGWMYAWWKSDRKHRYWRVYGGDVEVRRWFGKRAHSKPLTGHHLGLYAQMLTYDIEWGGKGYLGPKWSYGGGLKYGYSQPVARRLNLDFSLGVGYLHGKYFEYDKPACETCTCYPWKATKTRNWFGPTEAEISLVWLIGHGNWNKRKGGE